MYDIYAGIKLFSHVRGPLHARDVKHVSLWLPPILPEGKEDNRVCHKLI